MPAKGYRTPVHKASPSTLLYSNNDIQRAWDYVGGPRGEYRCVRDPVGCYRGSKLYSQDFLGTLLEGYLPPGSIWEHESGQQFRVVGNEGMPVDTPEGEWQAQRLEAI